MKILINNKGGYISLLTILFLGAALAAGGYFIITRLSPPEIPAPIACTQEAKLCPDGSYVGRTGPSCEFAKCPDLPPQSRNEVRLREGEREGPLLVQQIHPTYVTGLAYREYPVATDQGEPITLRIGESVSNGCTITLTLLRIEANAAVFDKKEDFNRPCPICLAEDTLIDTPSGRIAVQDLQAGMEVWTADSAGRHTRTTIIQTVKTPVPATHQMVRLLLSDRRELYASPLHPTSDGRTMTQIVPGNKLDGAYVMIAELVPYRHAFTYDLLPAGATGSYWANGILVGSTLK